MQYYMDDEKWKLSSRDDPNTHSSYSSSSNSKSVMTRSASTSSGYKPPFAGNSSQKNSSFRSPLTRSCSQKCSAPSSSTSKSSLPRSSSQRCADFTRKCSNVAKEQRAKFYIVKRCITMLVRWSKNGDS